MKAVSLAGVLVMAAAALSSAQPSGGAAAAPKIDGLLTDASWAAVRHTPSVTGFVAHANAPVPLSLDEVEKMLSALAPEALAAVNAQINQATQAGGINLGGRSSHRVGRLTSFHRHLGGFPGAETTAEIADVGVAQQAQGRNCQAAAVT